jgi:hypothetical protein
LAEQAGGKVSAIMAGVKKDRFGCVGIRLMEGSRPGKWSVLFAGEEQGVGLSLRAKGKSGGSDSGQAHRQP